MKTNKKNIRTDIKKQFVKVYEIANGDKLGIDSFGVTILDKKYHTKTTQCLSWEDAWKAIIIRHTIDEIYLLQTNKLSNNLLHDLLSTLKEKSLNHLKQLAVNIDEHGIAIEDGLLYSEGGDQDIFGRILNDEVVIDDCGEGYRVKFDELNITDLLHLIEELEVQDESQAIN